MRKILVRVWKLLLKLMLCFLVISLLWVVIYRFVDPPITYLMVERYFSAQEGRINKEWKDLDEISMNMQLAVIAAEDQQFLDHWGFDMEAIDLAIENNKDGKRMKGASTISQQTAKNVFLWHGRTWVRKGLEAWFTLLIELVWGKERILEIYLNVVELGPGVYGAEAAAQEFFGTSAVQLNSQQAALIGAVLPNPIKMSVAKPSAYVRGRQQWVLRQMRNLEGLLNDQFAD